MILSSYFFIDWAFFLAEKLFDDFFLFKDPTTDPPLEGANMASGMAVFTNVLEGSA